MLNFLRKLRRNNVNAKYIKYAIGEIFLVVIGILIALQINNWNEGRKNEEQLIAIIKEIRNDIKKDIPQFELIFRRGKIEDSLTRVLLFNRYDKDTLTNRQKSLLFYTALQYQPYQYTSFGFDKLQSFMGTIPEKYQSLMRLFNVQYSSLGPVATSIYQEDAAFVGRKHEYLALNEPWYGDFRGGEITQEAEEFFTEGYIYKNWLAHYLRGNVNHDYSYTYSYFMASITSLIMIDELLGLPFDENVTRLFPAPSQEINDLIGTYTTGSETFQIFAIGPYLVFDDFIISQNQVDYFHVFSNKYIRFNRDENGHVISIMVTAGSAKQVANKIE